MNRTDFFSALRTIEDFHRLLEDEGIHNAGQQRPFGILRIEGRGVERARDLLFLYRLVAGVLRRSDRVVAVGGTGLAVLLRDADAARVDAVASRVRSAVSQSARFRLQLGGASVGPRAGGWEEAWRMAGALLVADGSIPAAA